MKLERLGMRLATYGVNEGRFIGAAEFAGNAGKIELNLSPEQCERIFEVLADCLVNTAKESAQLLTVSILEHQKVLESSSK